jgi:hypothetical protein
LAGQEGGPGGGEGCAEGGDGAEACDYDAALHGSILPLYQKKKRQVCDLYRGVEFVVTKVCGRGLSELLSIKLKMTSPSWQVWEVSTSLRCRLAAELDAFDTS